MLFSFFSISPSSSLFPCSFLLLPPSVHVLLALFLPLPSSLFLGTNPSSFSEDMFSWFPLYFPLSTPIYLPVHSILTMRLWRCVNVCFFFFCSHYPSFTSWLCLCPCIALLSSPAWLYFFLPSSFESYDETLPMCECIDSLLSIRTSCYYSLPVSDLPAFLSSFRSAFMPLFIHFFFIVLSFVCLCCSKLPRKSGMNGVCSLHRIHIFIILAEELIQLDCSRI